MEFSEIFLGHFLGLSRSAEITFLPHEENLMSGREEGERVPLILIRVYAHGNYTEMTEKRRTTVTTIETHEVWIIRKPESSLSEVEVLTHDESEDLEPASPLTEANNGVQTGQP